MWDRVSDPVRPSEARLYLIFEYSPLPFPI
jgi:hypothetical protein